MFEVFMGLLRTDTVCIDNIIFRLHCRVTVIILVMASFLVTIRQYIGDPINCAEEDVLHEILDTYCWVYSTFTLLPQSTDRIGKNIVQLGVSSHVVGEVRYHDYYQWFSFVLYFQAMFFYFPRYLWKSWEGGRIEMLLLNLNLPIINKDCIEKQKKLLIDCFVANLHEQNSYAYLFFLCEFLNFANVIVQIFFMDCFLKGEFSTYGFNVLWFSLMDPELRVDPMSRVVHKVTMCTFHKYSPSGSIQNFDSLCILPFNIFNEKIYCFLWFWFLVLIMLNVLNIVYRIAVLAMPKFRLGLLRKRSHFPPRHEVETITKNCQISDWLVLYQLGKSIDPLIYRELVSDLAKRLDGKESYV